MSTARVVAVTPGSPAAAAGLRAGDEILALCGEPLRDVIAYQISSDEPEVALEYRRGDRTADVLVSKPAGAPLGLELESSVFDRVRTCDNHCPFCFIHQLPRGMRRSLYLRDDDYRLSFLYGNFTTLTRFTEADLERVVTEKLTPLYVSIHATDPALRARLLRNPRGATSLRWLRALLDEGVEVHGQIVVCPGVNDGPALDDTLLGVIDRYPELSTLGIVPLGISDHSTEEEMRAHTVAEAAAVVDTVERWQARYERALGRRLAFVSDEYYLLAQRPFPALDHYERIEQHENGIGMVRTFEAEVEAALVGHEVDVTGTRAGFFAWADGTAAPGCAATARPTGQWREIDGAPGEGYRAPRTATDPPGVEVTLTPGRTRPVWLLTGSYGAMALGPVIGRLGKLSDVPVRLREVPNRFFGGNIGVTGLLTGRDIASALSEVPGSDRVLLPDVVLSDDRFLDGSTLADLPRPVEVVPTDGASLVGALGLRAAAR